MNMYYSILKPCSPIKVCLPSKVVFRKRSSSINGCLPSKVVFHQMSSSNKGCLPSKVVFHRSSSISDPLPSKVVFLFLVIFIFVQRCVPSINVQVVFCQKSSSVKGHLQSKVVICQRSSSVKSCLPSKVVFLFWVIAHSVHCFEHFISKSSLMPILLLYS